MSNSDQWDWGMKASRGPSSSGTQAAGPLCEGGKPEGRGVRPQQHMDWARVHAPLCRCGQQSPALLTRFPTCPACQNRLAAGCAPAAALGVQRGPTAAACDVRCLSEATGGAEGHALRGVSE
eukprot:373185-Pelagomonas_calceolata.AAC.2